MHITPKEPKKANPQDLHLSPPICSFPNSHTSHKPRHDCRKHVSSRIQKKSDQITRKGKSSRRRKKSV
ncbi:hypothetical protein COCMIDRAFT_85433 [Bipolaris oryzae ATCC 44560]|uniref:Uncharacterized protein n=1 Tax=Bipolaris oryzae ATCC 44560 TaxID=930090 RepID=W6ZGF9_COCMI|nr:uncharacterized protein COCMIDRAFT_85433 [Bipolaris oryzae ATCC 44560]EUC49120.1 hypothetical protein COCMIDRAFT_85433 [Bipolaris oryzae ATCC 44560]